MLRFRHVMLCLLLAVVSLANAQSKKVTGQVTSEGDGEPIPGVTIMEKGASGNGTVTDLDGQYEINISKDDAILIYSFIGMETVEVSAAGKNKITIKLSSGAIAMDELVITAMGVSRDKKSIGYASQSVGGKEIASAAVVNPMNALQGKVAGVDIATAPGPGATQNVMIRGASSLSNNQPLYVIDGVPITNSQNSSGSGLNNNVDFGSGINAINPDDIANMTILKGAAATALYGSRAANGVIMITSKAGKNTNGKMKISYDGSISVSKIGRTPLRQSTYGQGWSGDYALDENGNWGPEYDNQNRPWGYVVDNSQQVKPYSFVENRIEDFYDLGVNYKNAISAYGGNENTNYFLSFSQNSVDGVNPGDVDTYDRYTISTRGSHKYKKLTLSSSVNYSNEKTKAVPSGQGTTVFRSLWEIPENYSLVDMEDYNSKFNNLNNYFTPYGVNPYFSLNENSASQVKHKVYGKAQADYAILDNLKATYRFGGDYETSTFETKIAQISIPESAPSYNETKTTPGSYEIQMRSRYEINNDFLLDYNQSLGSKIDLTALAGININQRGYNRLAGEVSALDVPGFYNLTNGTATATASQTSWKRRLIGALASVELSYNKYFFLNLSARNDWSSTLPSENNSFFYSGATGSLLISEVLDQAGSKPNFLDYAKVRVAYGTTGNDAAPYKIYPYYEAGYINNPGYPDVDDLTLPMNGINAWTTSNTLGSPTLKPEITGEFEVGFEANFFEDRIGFDFSYYNRLTEGLITSRPLDPSSGFTSITTNLGDIRNKGIEVLVHGSPVRTEDFQWDMSVNYSQNNNLVESLPGGTVSIGGFGGTDIVAIEGEEMGLFRTTIKQTVMIDGQEHVVVDGTGMLKESTDAEIIKDKSVNEKFKMGMTNVFTYKSISLAATLDFRYGGYMYSYQKDYMQWTGSGYETTSNDRQPFIIPNSVVDNGDGTYSENTTPVASTDLHTFYSDGAFESQEDFLLDKSYLKLRNISLSYQLPRSFAQRLKLSSIRTSIVASNILLWTPSSNNYIDPETTSFGNDMAAKFGEYGANPTTQTYSFSLSLSF